MNSVIEIEPVKDLDATVEAPPSKAYTLRALFMASLAGGKSSLQKPLLAEDQLHAIEALKQFGSEIMVREGLVEVDGTAGNLDLPEEEIFIGNSGVTMRLLATYAALAPPGKVVVTGDERMCSARPIQDLLDALGKLGVKAVSGGKKGCPPIEVQGNSFEGGTTELKGNISSQYFSSILISAPYAKKDVKIKTVGRLTSKPYIDMTVQSMKEFGVEAENENYRGFSVKAGQKYRAREYVIEGDYTNASYFFAAAAVTGGKVRVRNLNTESAQGDKVFVGLLEKMGCRVEKGKDFIEVEGSPELKAITADMNSFPDLVPTIAVVAAFAKGKSEFTNIGHLKFKESDRVSAPAAELKKMGIKAATNGDSLVVRGGKPQGAEIETYNDHRIAMGFAVAGLKVPGVKIKDPDCVKKSFPKFFRELEKMRD